MGLFAATALLVARKEPIENRINARLRINPDRYHLWLEEELRDHFVTRILKFMIDLQLSWPLCIAAGNLMRAYEQ